jgi:hypothetical protein
MMSKWFAVGAALLAALIPWTARAGALELQGQDAPFPVVVFTGPTSFGPPVGPPGSITGDACWFQIGPPGGGDSLCGGYGFGSISGLPGTSQFDADFNLGIGNDARLFGTVEWTAVEDYPVSPELIGTFSLGGISSDTMNPLFAELAADFPPDSVDPITLSLEAPGTSMFGFCPGPAQPLSFCIEHGEILTPVPEPATLSILGVALGIFLMACRSVRPPREGPAGA